MSDHKSAKNRVKRITQCVVSVTIGVFAGLSLNQSLPELEANTLKNIQTSANQETHEIEKIKIGDDGWYEPFYDQPEQVPLEADSDDWFVAFYDNPQNIPGYQTSNLASTNQEPPSTQTDNEETNLTSTDLSSSANDGSSVETKSQATTPTTDETQLGTSELNVDDIVTYFHHLVNQERMLQKIHILDYGDHLQMAAENRNSEIQEQFSHTRPNGQPFNTANGFDQGGTVVGENLQHIYVSKDTSNQYIAEKLFNNWKKSPDHYQNMIDESYLYQAIELDYFIEGENIVIYATHIFSN